MPLTNIARPLAFELQAHMAKSGATLNPMDTVCVCQRDWTLREPFLPLPEVFVTFVVAHVKVVSWTATSNARGKAKPRKFIFTVSTQRGLTVQAYLDCVAVVISSQLTQRNSRHLKGSHGSLSFNFFWHPMLSSCRKSLSSKLKRLVETKDVKTGNREKLLKYLMTLSLIE